MRPMDQRIQGLQKDTHPCCSEHLLSRLFRICKGSTNRPWIRGGLNGYPSQEHPIFAAILTQSTYSDDGLAYLLWQAIVLRRAIVLHRQAEGGIWGRALMRGCPTSCSCLTDIRWPANTSPLSQLPILPLQKPAIAIYTLFACLPATLHARTTCPLKRASSSRYACIVSEESVSICKPWFCFPAVCPVASLPYER